MSTRNGTEVPRAAGPITRFTSRAWNRIAIRPGASSSTAACSASVQTPEGAHWFKLSRDGSGWIVVRLVEALTVWRREAVSAPIAQVCLGRSHIAPIRLHLGALGVDGHERRIELVGEGTPDGVVAIKRDRVIHPHVPGSRDHVVDVALKPELGRMNPD